MTQNLEDSIGNIIISTERKDITNPPQEKKKKKKVSKSSKWQERSLNTS